MKPDLMEWLKERALNDASYGDMFADAENEIIRLRGICVMAHDRLLRGDSDNELLQYLQTAWRTTNK